MGRRKEEFVPISEGKVGLYTCGPTVYNFAHIGNMIPYIVWDVLKRTLRHEGYEVRHVMNITDVGHLFGDADYGEDKVRSSAVSQHKTLREIADFYTKQFMQDAGRLNIIAPDVARNASDEVDGILVLVGVLERKGFLYRLANGEWYDTSKFKEYGALTGMTFTELNESLKAGARVERPEGLRNITDFVVWRLSDPDENDMVWDSEYGRGFPGWHIECSAISMRYLGDHFDIHCGGSDHIPVHHTNEIAQSDAAAGHRVVNYWLHNGMMTVDGGKMSKSLGNVYTLQDLADRGYPPLAYRYLVISSHYRSELNFTFKALEAASNALNRIYALVENLSEVENAGSADPAFIDAVRTLSKRFYGSLADDLGTPEALKSFHEIVTVSNQRLNTGGMTKAEARAALDSLLEIDGSILALNLADRANGVIMTPEVATLLRERERLREIRDFDGADRIRQSVREKYGIELVDTKDGVRLRKAR